MTPEQAVAHRLRVNHLAERLPAGDPRRLTTASRFGLQDTAPRDALLGLHARVQDCPSDGWADPALVQTYGPRQAVYVVPEDAFAAFTLGRTSHDPARAAAVEALAAEVCRDLGGEERQGALHPDLRGACVSGRIAVRWTTSALFAREVPQPQVDPDRARADLCRRHVEAFGPTTPAAFAWWAGVSAADARRTWALVADELAEVDLGGTRAWVLAGHLHAALDPAPVLGVRLLPTPDLRLLGRDRTGLFAGPGLRVLDPALDTHHPNGVLVDGRLAGSWGRRAGRVVVRISRPLPAGTREAIEAEALSMPVPGVVMSVGVVGG